MPSEASPQPTCKLCQVAVPVPLEGTFTYAVPSRLEGQVTPGVRVLVPFGGRKLAGIVTEFPAAVPTEQTGVELKQIEQVLDEAPVLSDELLRLGHWVADYYLAPEGEVLRSMLPLAAEGEVRRMVRLTPAGVHFASPVTDALRRRPLAEADLRRRFQLTADDLRKLEAEGIIERVSEARARRERLNPLVALSGDGSPDVRLTRREQRVVQLLISAGGPLPARELAGQAAVPAALIRKMAERGLLSVQGDAGTQPQAGAAPLQPLAIRPSDHTLNPQQQAVVDALRGLLQQRAFAAVLLYGVTGSGKTEVYMEAIADVVRNGGTALMLVPEIALTPAMAEQFQARFGPTVAILHSAFAGRRRSREWRRVQGGEARVVVGTRSAVFAPLDRPGIIIVDEEQDPSYKQEETPRYNGRDVALVRARNAGALAVLGSATPSLESRYNAAAGKYRWLELGERVEQRPLPQIEVVDMRQEFLERKKAAVFSRALVQQVERRLADGQQVILLLNRRGYSAVVTCRSCGTTAQCVNCSISLTYHRRENSLLCHYCDYRTPVPQVCPQCSSEHLYFLGHGSEKIEALVAGQFSNARVVRLDSDTARGKQQYESILRDFRDGKYDILVGTQMTAKGHDIHRVTLVGVVSADIALGLPDFRAAERSFQLLTQVAGRAGRGDIPGTVIIQTYFPDHYAIRYAAAHDYPAFYEKELRFRRVMHYPPFTALANILLRSQKLELAVKWSGALSRRLAAGNWPGVRILGPAAAPLAKLKQEFRYQFLIKSERRATLHKLLRDCQAFARAEQWPATALVIDVDPFTLM
jgi:primosomal protein N' (replication factor Y)